MRKVLIVALCLGFIGCASTGPCINKERVAQLKKGVTTQGEVLKTFGPPDEMAFNQDGDDIFTYTDIQARNSLWNYVPVFSFVHSEMKLTNQILTILFKKDVVDEYVFSSEKSEQRLKYGLIS